MPTPDYQLGLTVVTEISEGAVEPLRAAIRELAPPVDRNGRPSGPFSSLPTIHFARWCILKESRDVRRRPLPAYLVLLTEFDTDDPNVRYAAHVKQLVSKLGPELNAVYRHCVGYPGPTTGDEALIAYLHAHRVEPSVFYVGALYRSAEQIRREEELREQIRIARNAPEVRKILAEFARGTLSAAARRAKTTEVETTIRDHVLADPNFEWATLAPTLPEPPSALQRFGDRLGHRVSVAVRWFLEHLRRRARRQRNVSAPPRAPGAGVQNIFGHVVNVKRGRRWLLKLVLGLMSWRVRSFYRVGNLAGIETIHFARWVMIDGGRRLLFSSYYNGNWTSYMEAFALQASEGINGVWTNTVGYPRTFALFWRGCSDREAFRNWVKKNEIEAEYWYAGYPKLTLANVRSNTDRRRGLLVASSTGVNDLNGRSLLLG